MTESDELKLLCLQKDKELIVERRRLLQSQLMIMDYQEIEINNKIELFSKNLTE